MLSTHAPALAPTSTHTLVRSPSTPPSQPCPQPRPHPVNGCSLVQFPGRETRVERHHLPSAPRGPDRCYPRCPHGAPGRDHLIQKQSGRGTPEPVVVRGAPWHRPAHRSRWQRLLQTVGPCRDRKKVSGSPETFTPVPWVFLSFLGVLGLSDKE